MAENRFPIPTPSDEPPSQRAANEAEQFRLGRALDRESRHHARSEGYQDSLYRLTQAAIWLGSIVVGAGFLIVAWHYLLPGNVHWLSPEQLRTLHTIGSTGLAATVLNQAAIRYPFRGRR